MLENIIGSSIGVIIGWSVLTLAIRGYVKYRNHRLDQKELDDLNLANEEQGFPTFDTLADYDKWAAEQSALRFKEYVENARAEAEAAEAAEKAAAAKKRRSEAAKKAAAARKAAAAIPAKKTANTSRTRK